MLRGRDGYCPNHAQASDKADRQGRGTSAERGYNARHRRWRKMVLHRHPRCVTCLAAGRLTLSTVADHIVPLNPNNPHAGNWSLDNGQGLCAPCHNEKTAGEKGHPRHPHPEDGDT